MGEKDYRQGLVIISVSCSSENIFYNKMIKLPNISMPWTFLAREMEKKPSFLTLQRILNEKPDQTIPIG